MSKNPFVSEGTEEWDALFDSIPEPSEEEKAADAKRKAEADALRKKLRLNIVEAGNSLPLYTQDNMFSFGRAKKLGEYKIRVFGYRDKGSYSDPDTTVCYAYRGLYYSALTGEYIWIEKRRMVYLSENSEDEYNKNTRINGETKIDKFDPNTTIHEGIGEEESHYYLCQIYDKHKAMIREKNAKKAVREAKAMMVKKKKEAKNAHAIMEAISEESGYERNDCGIKL